jgi:hypothetical protein
MTKYETQHVLTLVFKMPRDSGKSFTDRHEKYWAPAWKNPQ